ncbi:MAG: TolC family protein [Deltaproteobacteria bacterium]|nr:TolC family protein [Deltaproteobacteria bacterium]
MKKKIYRLAAGSLVVLLFTTAPAIIFAEEYTLDDLYRIALVRSEIVKVAEENLVISEIGKDKAFSYLLPRLTATGDVTQYSEKKFSDAGSLIQPESGSSWGVQLNQTVSLSGRELTALGISRQFVTKSKYDVTAVREDYLLRFVASAYYNVLMARKVLEIAESNLERLSKYRDAAEKRLRIGEVTKTALLRAEGELSGAKSDRLQAQNGLELAMAVLARNAGIKDDFTLREGAAAEGDVPALNVFRERAFAMRADLKSMEVQKQIAADQIKYAEGAFWPTVSASAGYVGFDQHPPASGLNRESIYGGVALNFPIFDGGLRRAEVSEAKARERQAVLFYEDLKKGIGIEVQTAYLDLVTQKGILQFLDDQLAFARDNYQAVARQFDFGLSNSLDVLDANTLLVSAQTKAVSAVYNYRLALLRMKKATGTLLLNES